jgi:hypothetical protein
MAWVLANGKALRDKEIIIERPDGSRIAALASIEPLRDADGETIGAVNVFRESCGRESGGRESGGRESGGRESGGKSGEPTFAFC